MSYELIIGYGNELRGDDAAGLHVARALKAAGCHAIETHQLLPELAEQIAAATVVIFVDCDVTLKPGEVAVTPVGPAQSALHEPCSPRMLLTLAAELYGAKPDAFIIGIGPESLDLGAPLSVHSAVSRAGLLARRLASRPATNMEIVDPNVRAILDAIEQQGGPAIETLPLAEARKAAAEGLKSYQGDPEPVASVENVRNLRIYTPDTPAPRPTLVYFHGGGWVLCNLDTHDVVCRALCRASGAVVISVDYRLAPEHKFPAAVDDCYAAACWVANNAAALGIDPNRIALGGDSAGGNLATVISLKARDEKGPDIAAQVLVYPVANLASFDTPSYREFAEGYHLTRSEMEWFRDSYLAGPEDSLNPYASPLLAPDLSGLPPALVITAECDVLRDEGEQYARRLEQAGVKVTATRYPGMIHPFFSWLGALPQAREAIAQVARFLRAAASA